MADHARIRGDLERIYRAAVEAINPAKLIGDALDAGLSDAARTYVLAVGKASIPMALALAERLGDRLVAMTIVGLPPTDSSLGRDPRITICESSHPLPSEKSSDAAKVALAMLSSVRPEDLVIVALSGGASAMFALPPEAVPLADKIALTQSLLRSGASIRELNTVRKHLSMVKGGQLVRAANGARVISLIISDVPGDDLATIGSGLTAPDPTTFADAIAILKRRHLWGRAPESIRDHLERGNAGEVAETPKSDDPIFAKVTNKIIGSNLTALDAAAEAAHALGYSIDRSQQLRGEANDLGAAFATHLANAGGKKICFLAVGEPVVTVRGSGKGGRAQQAALAMGIELARVSTNGQIAALFAGTDGIDGPTDAAGAFAFPDTVARGQAAGVDAEGALAHNDAYNFFKTIGDLFAPGPTGTNASDIFIGLVNY